MVLVITHPHHLTYLLHSFLRSKLVLQLIKKFPAFGTSKFITVRTHKRPPPVPGLFCLQRKHLAYEYFITFCFSRGEVVSASPNPQAGGPPLVGYPRLLIQFIRSYPPYRRPFLHAQPEDTPCHGDRDPPTWFVSLHINKYNYTFISVAWNPVSDKEYVYNDIYAYYWTK